MGLLDTPSTLMKMKEIRDFQQGIIIMVIEERNQARKKPTFRKSGAVKKVLRGHYLVFQTHYSGMDENLMDRDAGCLPSSYPVQFRCKRG